MPHGSDSATTDMPAGHRTEANEGLSHRRAFVSRYEAKNKTWQHWQSNGCAHGLALHKIKPSGLIEAEPITSTHLRRKPKAVSSRQWKDSRA